MTKSNLFAFQLLLSISLVLSSCSTLGWKHNYNGRDYTLTSDNIKFLDETAAVIAQKKSEAINNKLSNEDMTRLVCAAYSEQIPKAPSPGSFESAAKIITEERHNKCDQQLADIERAESEQKVRKERAVADEKRKIEQAALAREVELKEAEARGREVARLAALEKQQAEERVLAAAKEAKQEKVRQAAQVKKKAELAQKVASASKEMGDYMFPNKGSTYTTNVLGAGPENATMAVGYQPTVLAIGITTINPEVHGGQFIKTYRRQYEKRADGWYVTEAEQTPAKQREP